MYCFTFLNTVDDEVQEHLEKAKAEKVIEEVVRNFKEIGQNGQYILKKMLIIARNTDVRPFSIINYTSNVQSMRLISNCIQLHKNSNLGLFCFEIIIYNSRVV